MFHLGKLLPRSSASAQSSSCNPTNRTSVVSAVLDRLRPRGCVRGRLCSQPGRRLQAAGHKAADQLRLQEHAEPRARLRAQGPSRGGRPILAHSPPRVSQPPVGQPEVDISSPVTVPYSLLCVCVDTHKGKRQHNFWQLPFLSSKHQMIFKL